MLLHESELWLCPHTGSGKYPYIIVLYEGTIQWWTDWVRQEHVGPPGLSWDLLACPKTSWHVGLVLATHTQDWKGRRGKQK